MARAQSPAYCMGFARAQSAGARMGKYNLSPSTMDHEEYGSLWGAFLAGWWAGLRDAAREDWGS